MDFVPDFTFHCLWKLTYSHETLKHFGSCTIGRRGPVVEAAFGSQVSKKPRYVKVSGNLKSFIDKRPKCLSVIVALKNSNPELLVIESCKDVNLFERFVNILKDVRANEREDHLKTDAFSPRSPKPSRLSYSFMGSPSKQFSRGSQMLQIARHSHTDPKSSGARRITFYNSPSPTRSTTSLSEGSLTPKIATGDQQKSRRLLILPSVRKPLEFQDDFDFETPLMKRPKFEPERESAFRSLKFESPETTAGADMKLNGLSNIGNSCYMNAILQSLLSLDCFSEDMSDPVIQKYTKPKSLYQILYLLVKSISSKEPLSSRSILLKELRGAISSHAKQFAGQVENDAHEFLSQLLSLLCEEWSSLLSRSPGSGLDGVSVENRTCPVVSNFQFTVKTTISCKRCGHKRTSEEMYYDLPIYLPRRWTGMDTMNPLKLHDVLNAFFEDEVIECKCTECGYGSSELCRQLAKLPRVLILQLKRYQYDPVKGIFFKLKDPVTLPALIDLESYCVNNIPEPPVFNAPQVVTEEKENFKSKSAVNLQVKNEFSYRKRGEAMYRLMSVVSHTGGTSSGHYISDVYSLKENTWQSCNDSSITKVTEEEVRSKRQQTGYVLFYMHQSVFQSVLSYQLSAKT